jgi:hypothetical protein
MSRGPASSRLTLEPVSLLPPLPTPVLPDGRREGALPAFLGTEGKCASSALVALFRQALGWIADNAAARPPEDWPLLFMPATQFALTQNLLFRPPLDWSSAAPYARKVLSVKPVPSALPAKTGVIRHLVQCALCWTIGDSPSSHQRRRLAAIAAGVEKP